MKKMHYLSFFLFALCTGAYSQQLTQTEQKIIQTLRQQQSENEKFLEKVVNINSGTLNKEGVRQVGKLMAEEFDKLGFKTEWITFPDSLPVAGHLVATRQGKKGKKLFLIGHLDTVFEKSLPMEPFTRVNDSTITGQGVRDMKGGDVMIIAIFKALQAQKLLDDASYTVYLTGDEETAGSLPSRRDFIERAKKCDLAIGFEPAIGKNTVATGRRGGTTWTLEVKARTGHSSKIFAEMGYGAIYEAARIINEFRRELGQEKDLTFNPGLFAGGSQLQFDAKTGTAQINGKENVVAGTALVKGDLRFLTNTQKESAKERMGRIVEKSLPLTHATISFRDLLPAMEPTAANDELRKTLEKVSLDLGLGPVEAVDPGTRGGADISYIAQYLPCIDGIGAPGRGEHSVEETMYAKEYPLLIQRAALFVYRLTR